jgi:hypothetical protein
LKLCHLPQQIDGWLKWCLKRAPARGGTHLLQTQCKSFELTRFAAILIEAGQQSASPIHWVARCKKERRSGQIPAIGKPRGSTPIHNGLMENELSVANTGH